MSFIYYFIFYAFTYYKIYSISIVILHARSHALYLWLHLYSMPILHTHSYALCSKPYSISMAISILYSHAPYLWLYSIDYALYIAQFCILKSMCYGKYFMKLASYIAQFFMLLLTIKFALCLGLYLYSMAILYARSYTPWN